MGFDRLSPNGIFLAVADEESPFALSLSKGWADYGSSAPRAV